MEKKDTKIAGKGGFDEHSPTARTVVLMERSDRRIPVTAQCPWRGEGMPGGEVSPLAPPLAGKAALGGTEPQAP